MNNLQPQYPCVKLSNTDLGYSFTLDLTISYREVLVERLRLLEEFTANNTLESATQLIKAEGIVCTQREVDMVFFGDRGMISSTKASIEGNNPWKPRSTSKLTRKDTLPFLYDENNKEWVRGVVREGMPPQRPITNTLTAIRRLIEAKLQLPMYIRHQLVSGDETVDRNKDLSLPS
jgi:hypothetical protein